MKQFFYIIIVLVSFQTLQAQDDIDDFKVSDSIVDHKYREDQFYASVTYNLLGKKPGGVSQSGFSSGFHFGFIRDMPINTKRNIAIGIGLGLSANSYNQTLLIAEDNGALNYSVLDDNVSFSKNKFTTYFVELPFEFRWRTSNASDYEFWRIYTGFKLGYVIYSSSKFIGKPDSIKLSNIEDLNKLQYGITLSAGYSNVNFHLYYALNTIFNADAKLNSTGESVDMNVIKIGLMFYIL